MANLFNVGAVNFICSCGMLRPIIGIYFCRHCLKVRCGNCISHEVDTLYCLHCSENMPATEARLKKNRCANCFDCPSCGNHLSTRTSTVHSSVTEDQNNTQVARKVYYLGCTNCRWTTREVGLEDQITATGGWNERDNPSEKRIQDLFDYYRGVGQREKYESEKKKSPNRKSNNLSFSEKYSLSSSFSSLTSRKSLGTSFNIKMDSGTLPDIESSIAVDEVIGIPQKLFNEQLDLSKVSTLEQRLASLEWQPKETSGFFPMRKHILVKKSHRCRQCEHNLSKPEYNPSSIKFKIQLGAYYHVPEIRIVKVVELKCGETTTLQLSLCNPTPYDMPLSLLPFVPEAYFERENVISTPPSKTIPLQPVTPDLKLTAKVVLPQGEMILAARDDTAEYDDADKVSDYKDDPSVVAWRHANKVGVNVEITPKDDCAEAVFGLMLRYEYTNSVATSASSRTVTLNLPVVINAGNVIR